MEAMAALAPALGVDAAALVGRAAHAERTREAATRLQAAWRGWRTQRAYLRLAVQLWSSWIMAMMRAELDPRPLARARARVVLGRVLTMDTDAVQGTSAASTPWVVEHVGAHDVE